MSKRNYSKIALTYSEQLQRLKDRGLVVNNEKKAVHLLENISYYRLSGYWYPLLAEKDKHTFKPSANLDTAFNLYCFDRKLRSLLLSELEKIEIAVRGKMTYILAHSDGAFWFNDSHLFADTRIHMGMIKNIQEEFTRSDEEFIRSFKENYNDPIPPAWILMEVVSFGSLSKLYKNLKPSPQKREIAKHFGISQKVMNSWLHSIVYLRNVCAHHSRLWNRNMSIQPLEIFKPKKPWIDTTNIHKNRTYYMLCITNYFLQTVNPASQFKQKLKNLLAEYPQVDTKAMNFPDKWQDQPLWKK